MNNYSEDKKNLNIGVKEYKERTFLKRIVFIDRALSYASLRNLLLEKENVQTTRQYLYGIISGRLTPSYEFAVKLCRVLGLRSIYTVFEQNEIYLPDFQIATKLEEKNENNSKKSKQREDFSNEHRI